MSRKQGPVETDEYAAMLLRMVRSYARRVADGDYSDLEAMARVRAEVDRAMGEAVRGMRERQNYSWSQIGAGLGISAQGAQQRFGAKKDEEDAA